MQYQEYLISDPLFREVVLCCWQMQGKVKDALLSRHLPKAQGLLIFNFGDLPKSHEVFQFAHHSMIIPPLASSQQVLFSGEVNLFGVSFIGDGLYLLTCQPIGSLRENLSGTLSQHLTDLREALIGISFKEQCEHTMAFLASHMPKKSRNTTFAKALDLIAAQQGKLKIHALAHDLQVSERQLQRLFKTRMGLSPKDYSKIVRVNNYLDYMLAQDKAIDWMDLVVAFDYHDQPHLINEVKSIAQLSPQKLVSYRDTLYLQFELQS